ncbi:MAG TPA: hypothetical protein VEK34_16695 [Methylocella sp.]|nr:hypothetical protein [Methylocella sp.]
MSTTHLVYDTGLIAIPAGFGLKQIGPNLDIRKYAKIRVMAHEVPPPVGAVLIDLLVTEGSVSLPLALGLALPFGPIDAVFDVPGRELQIFVRDFPGGAVRKLHMFVFGLEL